MLAFVDTPHPSHPRRRALRGPLVALAGAIALYVALWVRLMGVAGGAAFNIRVVR